MDVKARWLRSEEADMADSGTEESRDGQADELPASEATVSAATMPTPDLLEPELSVFDRREDEDERLEADVRERVFRALIAAHPEAPVGAHAPEGVMVDMPASLTLERNPVQKARSGADLIVLDEQVMNGWERLLRAGVARYPVTSAAFPDVRGTVYAVDLRERHGALITIAVMDGVDPAAASAIEAEAPAEPPRFATVWKSAHGVIIKADDATTRMLGYPDDELVGRRSLEFIHPEDHALAVDNWMQMLAVPGPGRRVRLRHKRRDGSWIWLELTNHNLFHDPDFECAVSELVDISEEMAAHELVDRLARAVPVGLLQVDSERRIAYSNDRLHEILGVERTASLDELLVTITAEDRELLEGLLAATIEMGSDVDIEVELQLPGVADLRRCSVGLRPLTQEEGLISGAIACVTDVTEGARLRDELNRRATFDELTGCYNRAATMRLLGEHLAASEPASQRAVMFVDVDGFKAVNDRHGHVAGDEVLRVVATRLRDALRAEDIVGRVGGDEFLVVCPEIGTRADAEALAARLGEVGCLEVGDTVIDVAISIGVAWSLGEETDADTLVARADHAMYEAKRAKRSGREARAPGPRRRPVTADRRAPAAAAKRGGPQVELLVERGEGAGAALEPASNDGMRLGHELKRHRADVLRSSIARTQGSELRPDVLECFEQFNVRSTVAFARWLAAENQSIAREAAKDTCRFYGEMAARHEVQLDEIIRRCLAWRDSVAETLVELAAELGVGKEALEDALRTLQQSLESSLVIIARSIDEERERTDDQLAFMATHDHVTGLPNRSFIADRINQLLVRSRRYGTPIGALTIGIDSLNSFTDTIGPERSDELLCAIAERMDGCVRDTDALGRIGEDEFIVIVEEQPDGDGALQLAERLREALDCPFPISGGAGPVSISVRMGLAAGCRSLAEELICDAATAMHDARWKAQHRLAVFEPSMKRTHEHRHQLKVDLRGALARGEMELAYQPIVALADLHITGVEALLRWKHPMRGLVPPSIFIPLLEEDELIVDVGAWVLEEACRLAASCQKFGLTQMSVNVSARQLDDAQLVSQVSNALSASKLDAGALTLELTETTLMHNVDVAGLTLRSLRELGVRIAIDDFGTGYSSLSHLQLFPVDELKIDRSFVSRLGGEDADPTLVRTMLELGNALGMRTVAEGIETEAQLEPLRQAGCDAGQGFLLARPQDGVAATELVKRRTLQLDADAPVASK